jgi:hypothetical protein
MILAPDPKTNREYIKATFMSGLLSGAINKLLTHPIDTIKTKLNVNSIGLHPYLPQLEEHH